MNPGNTMRSNLTVRFHPPAYQFLHIQLFDRFFKRKFSYWSNSNVHFFHDLEYSFYELKISDAFGHTRDYVLELNTDNQTVEIATPFGWDKVTVRMDTSLATIGFRNTDKGERLTNPMNYLLSSVLRVTLWQFEDNKWFKGRTVLLAIDRDEDLSYEIVFDHDPEIAYGIEFDCPDKSLFNESRFLLVPPDNVSVFISFLDKWLEGSAFFRVQVRSKDHLLNALAGQMLTGDIPAMAALMEEHAPGNFDVWNAEDKTKALLIAYYLLHSQRLPTYHRKVREIAVKFLGTADAYILLSWFYLAKWNEYQSDDIVIEMLSLTASRVPIFSVGMGLLYELIGQLEESPEFGGTAVIRLLKKEVISHLIHLVPNQTYTMFKNYRPLVFTNQWEPTDGENRLEMNELSLQLH